MSEERLLTKTVDGKTCVEVEYESGERRATPTPVPAASERIIAVAIRHDGLSIHMPPPARHGTLIHQCHKVGWPDGAHGEQGFMTSENRFVNREEALTIAHAAGQLKRQPEHIALPELYSEDLW